MAGAITVAEVIITDGAEAIIMDGAIIADGAIITIGETSPPREAASVWRLFHWGELPRLRGTRHTRRLPRFFRDGSSFKPIFDANYWTLEERR